MTSKTRALVAFTAALLVAGCSSGEDAGAGTEDLTRSLLAQPAGDGQSTPVAGPQQPAAEAPSLPVAEIGFNRGEASAPVKVVELSDYGCGYCRRFHEETFPVLLEQFIDTGMVEWKFVPYVTGMFDNSEGATEAAECTLAQNVDAFERLNSRLWDEQSAWKGSGDPQGVIRPWVAELGIDMAAFDGCVANDERLERVTAATALARQVGVRGTPTFVVIGYPPLQGALPTETFQQVLSAVYNEVVSRQNGG